jgi:hypothetical protein
MFVVGRTRRPTESDQCTLRSPSLLLNHLAKLSLRSVIGLVSPGTSFPYHGRSDDGSTWQGGSYVLSLQHH